MKRSIRHFAATWMPEAGALAFLSMIALGMAYVSPRVATAWFVLIIVSVTGYFVLAVPQHGDSSEKPVLTLWCILSLIVYAVLIVATIYCLLQDKGIIL